MDHGRNEYDMYCPKLTAFYFFKGPVHGQCPFTDVSQKRKVEIGKESI